MFKLTLIALFSVLTFVSSALGRTWTVEQDGSGDFSVIQSAVYAASDGDVIRIGPGHYTEYTLHAGGFRRYVNINYKSLELIGAGREQTLIGPPSYDPDGPPTILLYHNGGNENTIEISDIGFVYTPNHGIVIEGGVANIEECRFFSAIDGFHLDSIGVFIKSDGCTISNCEFDGLDYGVSVYSAANSLIERCQFYSVFSGVAHNWSGCQNNIVRNCSFSGGSTFSSGGVGFSGGASGMVHDCSFSGLSSCGVGFSNAGSVEVFDNVFDQSDGGGFIINGCDGVNIHDNIIASDSVCINLWYVPTDPAGLIINNNHLFRGPDGYFARFWETSSPPPAPVFVNMQHNYFGTTDIEEIESWILDGNDFPGLNMYIDFLPLADGPVSTEQKSLGGVKALYRDME